MRVIRDICAPTNKVVEKISMTPLREIRENPRKVLIFRWYESTRKFDKKLKHETLKTIGKDDERLTFWFSMDQNNRSANDLEQWD